MGNFPSKRKNKGDAEFFKKYTVGAILGKGSFAVVKKATRKSDGKEYAVKIIKKANFNPDELAPIREEVKIMRRIQHENIVTLIDDVETEKHIFLVLDLLEGGELFERIVAKGSFTEDEAAKVIHQVTSAISYLHKEGVVHRDLKPENLIYESNDDDSNIKITDFGLAKLLQEKEDRMRTACGTPGYVAPEILNCSMSSRGSQAKPSKTASERASVPHLPVELYGHVVPELAQVDPSKGYSPAVDMWSLGVILYILLCGFPPFYDENAAGLYHQIRFQDISFPADYWGMVSKEAKDLVLQLLEKQPSERATPMGVLAHPWVQGKRQEVQGSTGRVGDGQYVQNLRKYLARQKVRRGVYMIMTVLKLQKVLKEG